MQIFSSLLFGVSASLDALLLGITYGIRKIHIKLWQNLLISTITLLGTCLSVGFGAWILPLMPASLGKWLGSGILMILGVYYLVKSMITANEKCLKELPAEVQPEQSDTAIMSAPLTASDVSPQKTLAWGNTLTLGIALSANNIGIGLSASIAGLTLIPAAVMTLLFSVIFLLLGNQLGRRCLSEIAGYAADPISGLLLICLGVCEFFF